MEVSAHRKYHVAVPIARHHLWSVGQLVRIDALDRSIDRVVLKNQQGGTRMRRGHLPDQLGSFLMLALVVRNRFEAIPSLCGVLTHEGYQCPVGQGQDRGLAEVQTLLAGHRHGTGPELPLVIRVPEPLFEKSVLGLGR